MPHEDGLEELADLVSVTLRTCLRISFSMKISTCERWLWLELLQTDFLASYSAPQNELLFEKERALRRRVDERPPLVQIMSHHLRLRFFVQFEILV